MDRFYRGLAMLPELAKAELGKARQRLPANRRILYCAAHAWSGAAMR
jgi:hypothetical protein